MGHKNENLTPSPVGRNMIILACARNSFSLGRLVKRQFHDCNQPSVCQLSLSKQLKFSIVTISGVHRQLQLKKETRMCEINEKTLHCITRVGKKKQKIYLTCNQWKHIWKHSRNCRICPNGMTCKQRYIASQNKLTFFYSLQSQHMKINLELPSF